MQEHTNNESISKYVDLTHTHTSADLMPDEKGMYLTMTGCAL